MSRSCDVKVKLPKDLLDKLECNGAKVNKICSRMPLYTIGMDISDIEADKIYMDYLQSQDEVDPLLIATFGDPLNPFVNANIQQEVLYLLSCFQPMRKAEIVGLANFVPQPIPVPFVLPAGNGYQYHHAQIAIQRVQQEIEFPQVFANVCTNLVQLPSGNVICDLTIGYANCHIIRRITKKDEKIEYINVFLQ